MKKLLSCLVLLSLVATSAYGSCDGCDCDVSSRSFLAVRPPFQSVSPEMLSGFRGREFAREDGIEGALQFAVFGGSSTNESKLARYFFPFCQTSLLVSEEKALTSYLTPIDGDIDSQDFDIITVSGDGEFFLSKICIKPKQSVVGLGVNYRQSFWRDDEQDRGFFFHLSFPIVRVKNEMNLHEQVINSGGGADPAVPGAVSNMTEALRRPALKYARIDCRCDMTETGVADMELKLGYEWLPFEACHLEGYVGVLVPTGNEPSSRNLFSPVVGRGKHWGLMWGAAFGREIWRNDERERMLRIEYAIFSQYLFSHRQCRVFDLVGRPWSRYLLMYENEEAAQLAAADDDIYSGTPGANLLNLSAHVKPGFQFNMTTAFVYTSRAFQGELGVNLFGRQRECLELACSFASGPAIKSLDGQGITNPVRDITGNQFLEGLEVSVDDYELSLIKEEDIDLSSASSPAILTHTIYGSLGYRWDEKKYPCFLNIGASYEFNTQSNASVERWLGWAKLGFSF